MDYKLQGTIGVISGGTSGIGLSTAKFLVDAGARVFLVGRQAPKGVKALEQLPDGPGQAGFVQADVSTLQGCQKVAQEVKKAAGQVDFLINSAGCYEEGRLETVTAADFDLLMAANVKSTVFLSQQLLPLLRQGGSILNIASDAALQGNYGCPLYSAAKGAVVAFTRSLALDLAPAIRVNCLCPGDVATPLVEKQLQKGGYTLAEMAAIYPLGRIGRPEEIAHVICSVISPLNGFMTGCIISVDGGLTAK